MSESVKARTIRQKISGYRDIVRYHLGRTESYARQDYSSFAEVWKNVGKYLNVDRDKLRILDIGCGQRYPYTLLAANRENCEAVGIDTDIVGPGAVKYIRMLFKDGLERTVKSAVRAALFDPAYFSVLEREAGKKLSRKNLKIYNCSSENLPFADDYFDLVISNAVFEHIRDIPGTLAELNRVSEPGAIFHILIHLYPSLSGGHNLNWANPEEHIPENVPPWDHLRGNTQPTHIYLNKLREKDYRRYFEEYTEVLEWIDGPFEGQKLLTPEIEQELSTYSREELLKRYVIAVCRPGK